MMRYWLIGSFLILVWVISFIEGLTPQEHHYCIGVLVGSITMQIVGCLKDA